MTLLEDFRVHFFDHFFKDHYLVCKALGCLGVSFDSYLSMQVRFLRFTSVDTLFTLLNGICMSYCSDSQRPLAQLMIEPTRDRGLKIFCKAKKDVPSALR